MEAAKTEEKQYQVMIEAARERGIETLGLRGSESWYEDPRHLVFRLSRYKFVAKMLSGKQHGIWSQGSCTPLHPQASAP